MRPRTRSLSCASSRSGPSARTYSFLLRPSHDVGFSHGDLVKALCDPEEVVPDLGTGARKSLGGIFMEAYNYMFKDNSSCSSDGDPCSDEVLKGCKQFRNRDGGPHHCCPKEPSVIGAFLEKLYEDGEGDDRASLSLLKLLKNKLRITAVEDIARGSRR